MKKKVRKHRPDSLTERLDLRYHPRHKVMLKEIARRKKMRGPAEVLRQVITDLEHYVCGQPDKMRILNDRYMGVHQRRDEDEQ